MRIAVTRVETSTEIIDVGDALDFKDGCEKAEALCDAYPEDYEFSADTVDYSFVELDTTENEEE